jgi:PAS domain S-box-containing protein
MIDSMKQNVSYSQVDRQPAQTRKLFRNAVAFICLLGAYYISGKFGLSLAFVHGQATVVWPPTGLALAALLLYGRHLWPAIFIGALLVNYTTAPSWPASFGIALGNTFEALVGCWLVQRVAGGLNAFNTPRSIIAYFVSAVLASTAVSATFGVTTLCFIRSAAWSQFTNIWMTWWLGDAVSNIIVAPLLILTATQPLRFHASRMIEGTGLLIVTALVAFLAFGHVTSRNHPIAYLAVPPLIWAAFRFGSRGAATLALLISCIAIYGARKGFGPFVAEDPNKSLLFLQAFMATITMVALVLASVVREQQRATQALRDSEERFRVLADSAPVLIWVNGREGCQFVNRAYREFFDRPEEELLGFGWTSSVHPDDRQSYVQAYEKAAANRLPFQAEVRLRRADGQYRSVLSTGEPRLLPSGEWIGYVGSCTDITELVQAREALARHRAELEQTVTERTAKLRELIAELEAFSYSVSHDMRAPLRTMQGYANILLEDYKEKLGPDGVLLEKIVKSALRLDRLIIDVLAYSRVVRAELKLSPIDTEPLLRDLIEQNPTWHLPSAEVMVVKGVPRVMGNEALLSQCFTNLIGNAIKFVAPGTVPRVRIWGEEISGRTRISFQDNGIGIRPQDQGRIFGIFERVHGAQYEGTGIGLSIVRKAIERMGGSLGLDSKPGAGSTFWIELQKGE